MSNLAGGWQRTNPDAGAVQSGTFRGVIGRAPRPNIAIVKTMFPSSPGTLTTVPSESSDAACRAAPGFSPRRRRAVDVRGIANKAAALTLCAAGAPALLRRLRRGQLTILMYHGIEAQPVSPPCWHVLDAATFRRQLKYVRRHFTVLPLEEALERLYAGTLPKRAAALTFDDGTQNLLTQAAPVLREFELPAAVFLATGLMGTSETLWPDRLWLSFARANAPTVDLTMLGLGVRPLRSPTDRGQTYALAVEQIKDLPDDDRITLLESLITALAADFDNDPGPFRMLSWEEARTLTANGQVTIHPHTVTHPILSRCIDEKVEREIADSCTAVQHQTVQEPTVFAYPNGRAQDFDERAKAALRRRGVRWALATTTGIADRHCDPFALPRIGIGNDLSFAGFRLLVSGATPRRHSS